MLPAEAHIKTKGYSPLTLLFTHIRPYMPPPHHSHLNRTEARKEIHEALAQVPRVRSCLHYEYITFRVSLLPPLSQYPGKPPTLESSSVDDMDMDMDGG